MGFLPPAAMAAPPGPGPQGRALLLGGLALVFLAAAAAAAATLAAALGPAARRALLRRRASASGRGGKKVSGGSSGSSSGLLERCVRLILNGAALAARCAANAAARCGWRRRWPPCKVLVLGLDNAGKTALCNALAHRRDRSCWPASELRPEHHVLHHHASWRGHQLHLIDPNGKPSRIRQHRLRLWEELLRCRPNAVVFVVDAADASRYEEAQEALHWVLRHEALCKLPVLVLGTKIDLRSAAETWDLRCRLGLAGLSHGQRAALLGETMLNNGMPYELRHRIAGFHPDQAASPPHGGPLAMRMCSLKRRNSVDAGMQWLVDNMHSESRDVISTTGRQERGRRCTAISNVVEVLGQTVCGARQLRRQARFLPV